MSRSSGKRWTNPFKPTAGAEPPRLVGRDGVIADFAEGIRSGVGSPGRLMRITGPRGSGKTALITELGGIARDEGWRVVDVSAGPDLLSDVAEELSPAAMPTAARLSASLPFASGEVDIAISGPTLRSLMRDAAEGASGLLVTVDEVQDAPREDMRKIASAVQHLVRERVDVALVFAGITTGVMGVIDGEAMTFLRRAKAEELTEIGRLQVALSLSDVFSSTGLSLGGEALDAAARAPGGYAYLIQLVGFHIWSRANLHRDVSGAVTAADVAEGVAVALEEFHQAVHEPAMQGLSRNAAEYLVAMAASDGPSSTAAVARALGKKPSQASSYRAALVRHQVIEATARGYVDFSIPFLREYVRENAEGILSRYGEGA